MEANFNSTALAPNPPMGYTINLSATYLSTGNPCLDFFFLVVPNTPIETLNDRMYLSWTHNPLTTLKLICNLCGIHGTGKSDKEGYYTAALWLHGHHPKTLAYNVVPIAEFRYFKDFPEFFTVFCNGTEAVENIKTSGLSDLVFHPLDVKDPASIASLAKFVKTNFKKLDILVNNAGENGYTVNLERLGTIMAEAEVGVEALVNDENAHLLKGDVVQTHERQYRKMGDKRRNKRGTR